MKKAANTKSATKAVKPKKKAEPPEAIDYSCQGCNYLRVYHKDKSEKEIRLHCGRHTVTAEAMRTDGLSNGDPDAPPTGPETPPDHLVAEWDGTVKPVWTTATLPGPPPESDGWTHLREWADAVRAEHPTLTVHAIVNLYQHKCRGADVFEGIRRLRLLFVAEHTAECRRLRQEDTPKPKPADRPVSGTAQPPAAPTPTAEPAKPKPKATAGETGKDAWGYRTNTRASRINLCLMEADDWMTANQIEKKAGATSVGSHLSTLYANGHIDRKKEDGTLAYRVKRA